MKKLPSLLILLLLTCPTLQAQQNMVNSNSINTLQVMVNGEWGSVPIITLGSDDRLEISFDEMSHNYHRYTYYLSHCNADWSPSSLFEIDYLDGINGQQIEDYENSINTTMLYTHYRMHLPNDKVQMKVSGNYILSIFDDSDSDTPVIKACFMVMEPKVGLQMSVTGNTDIDTNKSHQQVSFTISTNGYNMVSPQNELTAKVYQNRRPDNCVTVKEPTYITSSQLQYVHNPKLIFDAGNEYRRFEVVNVYSPSLGVDQVKFLDPYFHAFLDPVKPRRNYSYDEDQDGRFLVRSNATYDVNTEADYLFVHYTLVTPPLENGDFYLAGDFTSYRYLPQYKTEYNEGTGAYESIQLQKQGAYNYLYLWLPSGGSVGETAQSAGNFYEAENEYMILLYHRPIGGRYDKLVGFSQLKYTQE